MKPISDKLYRSDRPCPSGHVGLRYKIGDGCAECLRIRREARTPEERARDAERMRQWRAARPDRPRPAAKPRTGDAREAARERSRKWRAENPERVKELAQLQKVRNPGTLARQRPTVRRATPAWAELREMNEFYKACPPNMIVDHVVPLAGRNVCGLHVLANLQYLTPMKNWEKSNKWSTE